MSMKALRLLHLLLDLHQQAHKEFRQQTFLVQCPLYLELRLEEDLGRLVHAKVLRETVEKET